MTSYSQCAQCFAQPWIRTKTLLVSQMSCSSIWRSHTHGDKYCTTVTICGCCSGASFRCHCL